MSAGVLQVEPGPGHRKCLHVPSEFRAYILASGVVPVNLFVLPLSRDPQNSPLRLWRDI